MIDFAQFIKSRGAEKRLLAACEFCSAENGQPQTIYEIGVSLTATFRKCITTELCYSMALNNKNMTAHLSLKYLLV